MNNDRDRGYLGNPNLKRLGSGIEWTPALIREFAKCSADPLYFAEKYIKIVHVDKGLIPIKMYDYQREILEKITNNRRVCAVTSRQAGKCLEINSSIRLRSKKTGEVKTMTVGELYAQAKDTQTRNALRNQKT